MRQKELKKFFSELRELAEDEGMNRILHQYEEILLFFDKFRSIYTLSKHLRRVEADIYLSKEFLSVEEAAKYLGFSQSQIYRLTSDKQIAYYKPGGKAIFFRIEDLNDWVRQNRIMPTTEMYRHNIMMAGEYNLNHADRISPVKGGRRC